jgi:hypothetical protein
MLKLSARDISQLTQTNIVRGGSVLDIKSEIQSIQYSLRLDVPRISKMENVVRHETVVVNILRLTWQIFVHWILYIFD